MRIITRAPLSRVCSGLYHVPVHFLIHTYCLIYARTLAGNAYKHMRHADWTALSRCKRLWAALALQSVLDGKSLNILCNEFGTETQDVEHLLHSAQIMCHKATRFCSQIGWTAMERMLTDFQQVDSHVCLEHMFSMRAT